MQITLSSKQFVRSFRLYTSAIVRGVHLVFGDNTVVFYDKDAYDIVMDATNGTLNADDVNSALHIIDQILMQAGFGVERAA